MIRYNDGKCSELMEAIEAEKIYKENPMADVLFIGKKEKLQELKTELEND